MSEKEHEQEKEGERKCDDASEQRRMLLGRKWTRQRKNESNRAAVGKIEREDTRETERENDSTAKGHGWRRRNVNASSARAMKRKKGIKAEERERRGSWERVRTVIVG